MGKIIGCRPFGIGASRLRDPGSATEVWSILSFYNGNVPDLTLTILQVCEGDTIRVIVRNEMVGETTTIHWHGIHQKNTPHFDGVPMVTECPINPKTTF